MTSFMMVIIFFVTSHLTQNALESVAKEKLAAVLEGRHNALNRWTNTLQAQMTLFAAVPTTIRVLDELSLEFQHLGDNAQTLLQQNYLVSRHHQNTQTQKSVEAYDKIHSIVQPFFMIRQNTYNWDDMFLIDTQGNVVFSLAKESDFATNLRTGPWRETGLARAVVPLLKDAIPNQLSFADYSQYPPSNMNAASFIAMPVFDKEKQRFLGVVAIQLPISEMSQLMIDKTGMGETGEVIAVGKDGWMLTDSRFIKESTILKKQIKARPAERVLAGESATMSTRDYRDIEIIATFKPFSPFPAALGNKTRWGIIAKIEHTEILQEYNLLQQVLLLTTLCLILLAMSLGFWGGRTMTRPLSRITDALTRLANNEQVDVPELHRTDEIGEIAKAAETFHTIAQQIEYEHWLNENVTSLTSAVSAESTVNKAAERVLQLLCDLLAVPVGAVYLWDDGHYQRVSTHGLARSNQDKTCFDLGVGLLGQCAKSNQTIVLSPVPAGLTIISTGLAEFAPHELVLVPIEHKTEVLAVVELAVTTSLQPKQHEFLKVAGTTLGLHFANLQAAEHNALLLVESSQLTAELQSNNIEMQAQSEELRNQSEEMKIQNEELKSNQEELRAQQEEALQKNNTLEIQSKKLKDSITEAEVKAIQLQQANQYKSEFLANMSHELRTPLNSILILSKSLAENDEQNLSDDQTESASVINESGTQLLTLINDILDLSKIEAGKLELVKEPFSLNELTAYLQRVFSPQVEVKGLALAIELSSNLPTHIHTDKQRLTQVLSNLLTNAIKFTTTGSVKVLFSQIEDDLQIEVIDSGVGIPPDKLEHIFGTFQQLDGSTSRKFGGSGLGLAISRNLMHLLGGEINVSSTVGQGSQFVVRLNKAFTNSEPMLKTVLPLSEPASVAVVDTQSVAGNILLVEDDTRLLAILGRMITSLGYTTILVESAEQALIELESTVINGIFLDLGLPNMNGMDLLHMLKANPGFSKIPVYIMSGTEDSGEAKTLGALDFLKKPVSRDTINNALKTMIQQSPAIQKDTVQQILLIEDNPIDRKFIEDMLKDTAIEIIASETGSEALQLMQSHHFSLVILDLKLPDMSGFDWLKQAQPHLNPPPIIIYSARELTENEVFKLKGVTESIITKDPLSDRLHEEILYSLSNYQPPAPVDVKQITGKKLLLVDDDPRNLYALTKALKSKGFEVEIAPDSMSALKMIEKTKFDVLITDIMMPEVDGYALIKLVRTSGYEDLPIIAVTAKAMQGDEELCIQAGANGYLSKPVNVYALIELINTLL